MEDERKELNSALEELQKRSDHLLAIIDGTVKPSAVDLPEEEASDFKTKLRLRVKGVRGIAVEKAREDLIPIEGEIEVIEGKIERIESRAKSIEKQGGEALKATEALSKAVRRQREALRELQRTSRDISRVTGLLGWQNPYTLLRKSLEEIMIASRKLQSKRTSVGKRRQEIQDYEEQISAVKDELRSTLGEAYEGSFMPLIFKDGRNPMGRRYLRNELTLREVNSLDVQGKITRHKTMDRRAERLSAVLRRHIIFIEESLYRIARLCQLRGYSAGMLERSMGTEKVASASLEAKCTLHGEIMSWAEQCGKVGELRESYLRARDESGDARERVIDTIRQFRSDL